MNGFDELVMKKEIVINARQKKRIVIGLKMINNNRYQYYHPIIQLVEGCRKVDFLYSEWIRFMDKYFIMRNFLCKMGPFENAYNLISVIVYFSVRGRQRVMKIMSDITNVSIYFNINDLVLTYDKMLVLKSYHEFLLNLATPAKYLLNDIVTEMNERYQIDLNNENIIIDVVNLDFNHVNVNILRYIYQLSDDIKSEMVNNTVGKVLDRSNRMRAQHVNDVLEQLSIGYKAQEIAASKLLLSSLLDDILLNNSIKICEIVNNNL